MTRYEQGFIHKCAEYGVDGRALLEKQAGLASIRRALQPETMSRLARLSDKVRARGFRSLKPVEKAIETAGKHQADLVNARTELGEAKGLLNIGRGLEQALNALGYGKLIDKPMKNVRADKRVKDIIASLNRRADKTGFGAGLEDVQAHLSKLRGLRDKKIRDFSNSPSVNRIRRLYEKVTGEPSPSLGPSPSFR